MFQNGLLSLVEVQAQQVLRLESDILGSIEANTADVALLRKIIALVSRKIVNIWTFSTGTFPLHTLAEPVNYFLANVYKVAT